MIKHGLRVRRFDCQCFWIFCVIVIVINIHMKNGVWKFETKTGRYFDLSRFFDDIENAVFLRDGRVAGHMRRGVLYIRKGYRWDGCSPKFMIFGKIIGTPDFEKTKDASLVHDFLIEYCKHHSLSRKKIDVIFCKMLAEKSFSLRFFYATGVHAYRILVNRNQCR